MVEEIPERRSGNSRWWSWALVVLAILAIGYSWLFLDISAPNERSRIYLTVAMVDQGTFAIDAPMAKYGRVFDLATHDGEFFTDKAPGSSVLAAPAYLLAKLFGAPESWSFHGLLLYFRLAVMLPLVALGAVALRRLLEALDVSDAAIDLATVAWLLGSAAFHYAGAFFGHHIVAVFLVFAIWQLERARGAGQGTEPDDGRGGMRTTIVAAALAGLAAGIAGLTEYQAGVASALIAGYLLTDPRLRRAQVLVPFGLGALVPLLFFFYYHNAAFGGPLELSYHHLVNEQLSELHTEGVGGVTLPRWEYFHGIVFSLHRGLVPTSPWVILAVPGALVLGRRRLGLTLLLTAIAASYVLIASSANMWFAGWGFGPRLLVPMLGLVAVLAAVGLDAWRRLATNDVLAIALVLAGVAYCQTVVAFFPELPPEFTNPLLDAVVPLVEHGYVSGNLGSILAGTNSPWTMLPLAAVIVAALAIALGRRFGARFGGRGWRTGLARTALAALVVAVVGATLLATPPAISDHKQKKFVRTVNHWRSTEARFLDR